MNAPRPCPKCGAPLPSDALDGHCPRCLIEVAWRPEPMPPPDTTNFSDSPAPAVRRFGDYALLGEIARGGMGVVYRARQCSLNRLVAVKMLLAGEFASPEFVRRFRREAEAAAGLQHPNIVAVYEVGEHGGQQFFSMELVEGKNLAEHIREQPLPARRAATWLKAIAEAVHYAHERGLLHRDLKPSNVLIDALDAPRITDFGLAKWLAPDAGDSIPDTGSVSAESRIRTSSLQPPASSIQDLTRTGQAFGSPTYMSPEQAAGKHSALGPPSDVYSLGAILYQMLTGRPPFQGETLHQILLQVQGADPVAPQLLNPSVPADLQTICLKGLEKEPAKRFQSAAELAEELGRFLRNEPIRARPVGPEEKLWRWCARNPKLAGALGALAAALVVGVSGILWQWQRAEDLATAEHAQRERAEQSEFTTRLNLYAADMMAASQAIERGDLGLGRRLLEAFVVPPSGGALVSEDQPHPDRLKAGLQTDLRGWEWRYLWARSQGEQLATLRGHTWIVMSAAFSPDGRQLATGSQDSTVKLWNPATQQLIASIQAHTGAVWNVSFTPEGDALVTSGSDGKVKFWNLETREVTATFDGQQMMLAATNSLMAVAAVNPHFWDPEGGIALWDWRSRRKLREFPDRAKSFALSADGTLLAVTGKKPGVRIWHAASGELLRTLPADVQTWSLNFSPDLRHLTAAARGKVLVWDLTSSNAPVELPHTLGVWSAKFSPDGRYVVTAASDRGVRLWDGRSFQLQRVLRGHTDEAWCTAFAPDGQTLASGGKDTTVLLWSLSLSKSDQPLPHARWPRPLFSPDGKRVVTSARANEQDHSTVWEVAGRSAVAVLTNSLILGFSPDGTCLLRRARDKAALEWVSPERQTIERTVELSGAQHAWPFEFVGFSHDYQAGFGIGADGAILVFDTTSGNTLGRLAGPRPPIYSAVLGSGAHWLAVSIDRENPVRLFEVPSGREVSLSGHRDYVSGLAFSLDGSLLASASVDATIKLWEIPAGRELATLRGHVEEATDVAFSPDGKTLASLGTQHSIKFWNVATRREVMSLLFPEAAFRLGFSPDGRHLAFTLGRRTTEAAQILTAPTLDELRQ
ncbi:MAG: serine/threonine protein kinase [Verrucomicrobia bacterium]|nr:serine/threonine protein kinase [Verrucomicrobiota bacterium]